MNVCTCIYINAFMCKCLCVMCVQMIGCGVYATVHMYVQGLVCVCMCACACVWCVCIRVYELLVWCACVGICMQVLVWCVYENICVCMCLNVLVCWILDTFVTFSPLCFIT